MTAYFSYIGQLEGEDFQWDRPPESNSASNLPPRLVPADKFRDIGISTQWMMQQIEAGRYDGKQLDWGAWGLKMTGAELRTLLGNAHPDADAIAALAPDTCYVLVSGELW